MDIVGVENSAEFCYTHGKYVFVLLVDCIKNIRFCRKHDCTDYCLFVAIVEIASSHRRTRRQRCIRDNHRQLTSNRQLGRVYYYSQFYQHEIIVLSLT